MAEALAGLGLAANVAQFIGLGMQLLSQGKEIYDSFSGTREAYDELELMVTQMEQQIEGILQASSDMRDAHELLEARNPRPTRLEKEIQNLASQCHPILKKLLSTLSDLKISKGARFRAWRAFGRTFKHATKKKEIEELKKRLFTLDSQLRSKLALLLQLRNGTAIDHVIQKLDEKTVELQAFTEKSLETYRQEVLDATQISGADSLFSHLPEVSGQSLVSTIHQLLDNAQRTQQQHKVLLSLGFDSMKQREDQIVDAHLATLDWIFDPEKTAFVKWLSSDNDIFWVKGKAGSGKSTLMKYLCSHAITSEQLLLWAKPQRLVTASFFFWITGQPMQKSQNGLLQSILYQLVATSPDMDLGKLASRRQEPWGRQELLDALRDIVQYLKPSTKLCFFIDGIDEYDGHEEDIVGLLQNLAASPNMKICLSSRPWNIFVHAFDKSEWKLVIEDLTRADMGKYVHEMMNVTDVVTTVTKDDIAILEFQIVEKAHGVWLWVFLVVRALLRDIRGGEDFSFLQRRLQSFPAELENYFETIVSRIDRIHECDTARIFLNALESEFNLPMLALKYILLEREDPDGVLKLEPMYDLNSRDTDVEQWGKLLNSRCGDLLEISKFDDGTFLGSKHILFIHRTAHDFLENNYKDQLLQRAGKDFNANLSLARIYLAFAKLSIHVQTPGSLGTDFYVFARTVMYYSLGVESQCGIATTTILDSLDEAGMVMGASNPHWIKSMGDPDYNPDDALDDDPDNDLGEFAVEGTPVLDDHDGTDLSATILDHQWRDQVTLDRSTVPEAAHERSFIPHSQFEAERCNFLALTIEAQLFLYVKDKIESDPLRLTSEAGRPLLDYALLGYAASSIKYRIIDLRIVELLLKNGANPNERIKSTDNLTVWHRFLICCRQCMANTRRSTQTSWFETAKLMIKHGAEMEIEGNDTNYVVSLLKEIFSKDQYAVLETLALRPESSKKQFQTSLLRRLLRWV